MAVQLERENARGSPRKNQLPLVVLRSEPVPSPKHIAGEVTGRTSSTFTCSQPKRNNVWKENYDRRRSQLSDGGFHCPPSSSYQEIGNVVMDDKDLILHALGQKDHSWMPLDETQREGTVGVVECPTLRARTPSQFPSELLSLHSELQRANDHLVLVRRGKGVFQLQKEDELAKQKDKDVATTAQTQAKTTEWQEATLVPPIEEVMYAEETPEPQAQDVKTVPEETAKSYQILSNSVRQWHRKLCVILWVLQAMKLDCLNHMPSVSLFWKVERPVVTSDKCDCRTKKKKKEWEWMVEQPTWISTQHDFKNAKEKHQPRPSSETLRSMHAEEKLRKQTKLTPEQMEQLKLLLDEELNYSKKKSRNNMKELMHAASMARMQPELLKNKFKPSTITCSVSQVQEKFGKVEEGKRMIVHEQLSVMERDRREALEQRFAALQIDGNMWRDLAHMRKGVQMETTAMAKNKLMMNYNWMLDLMSELPDEVRADKYCRDILLELRSLQEYMKAVGPQFMSQQKLIAVLTRLRPWELASPEISAAMQFITQHVIYTVPEDFQQWVEYHASLHQAVSS